MYLYNEFILNDINTLSCPSKSDSKRIELTEQTSCYWGLRLTLCYIIKRHLHNVLDEHRDPPFPTTRDID